MVSRETPLRLRCFARRYGQGGWGGCPGSGPRAGVCSGQPTPLRQHRDRRAPSVATANRLAARTPTPSTAEAALANHRWRANFELSGLWRCARAQALFAVATEGASNNGLDETALAPQSDAREWAGERACRHRHSARSRHQINPHASKQCTAQHPAPAPPTVPRETLSHRQAAQRSHHRGVCP